MTGAAVAGAMAACGAAALLWPARGPTRGPTGGPARGPTGGPERGTRPYRNARARWRAWRPAGAPGIRGRLPRVTGRAGPVGAVILVGLLASTVVPWSWSIAGVVTAATALRLLHRGYRAARVRRELDQLRQALRALSRELGSGAAPPAAVAQVTAGLPGSTAAMIRQAASMTAFTAWTGQAAAPGGLEDAAAAPRPIRAARSTRSTRAARPLRTRCPDEPELTDVLARLRAGWGLSASHGIPLAAVVAALADDVADRCAVIEARTAQVAGPAVSGYVLAALPAAGLLLGSGMGADPLAVLTGSSLGAALLVVGVLLCCGGLLWADRIVRG